MLSENTNKLFVHFLLEVQRFEHKNEVLKEILSTINEFHPYSAFLRLSNKSVNPAEKYITSESLREFLANNGK